jgi:hypothetical protein
MKHIIYILALVNLLGSKPCNAQLPKQIGFKSVHFVSGTIHQPIRVVGGHIMNDFVLHYDCDTIIGHHKGVFGHNTFIGYYAGFFADSGSYNFVVGDDSIAVNLPINATRTWYIQPSAKYFIQNAECLRCLLSVHPHIYGILPEDKALEIITNARKCLPSTYLPNIYK